MYWMNKILKILFLLFLLGVVYLLFYPTAIEPMAYTPPPNPGFQGDFAPNEELLKGKLIESEFGEGPEAIALGPDGLFYSGLLNGNIVRFDVNGAQQELFANTGGRPLGMKFDKDGNLIVADAYKGLLSVSPSKEVQVLTNTVDDGSTIFYADDLAIAGDGMIYFSDATQRNRDLIDEIWELQATGRLLSYNPVTKETKLVFDQMRFANGVVFGPDDDYVLVCETFGMVINKFYLKGPKKGNKEVWVNELPGFPDNITYNGNGVFWVAVPKVRASKEIESLFDKPFIRKIVSRLPKAVLEGQTPIPYGIVLGYDESGKLLYNLQDSSGKFNDLTSALEVDGALYLGSLTMPSFGKMKLDQNE